MLKLKLTSLLALSVFLGAPLLVGCDKKNDETDDDDDATGDDDDDNNTGDDDDDDTTGGDDDDDVGEMCGQILCLPGDPNACDGKKCSPYQCDKTTCCTESTRCTDITGMKNVGESCTRDAAMGMDDCAPTLFCFPNDPPKTSGDGPGECIQLCNPDDKDEGQCAKLGVADGHCFNFNSGSFPVCLPICDPLDPMCPEDESCFFGIDDFFCTASSNNAVQGEMCDTEQGCASGFACTPVDLLKGCQASCDGTAVCGCCSQYCDKSKGDEDCMTLGLKCLELPGDRPGVENVGVCGTPV